MMIDNPPLMMTFDDVLLVPQHSDLKSRRDPDLSTWLGSLELDIPIVAAPMNTVCERRMIQLMDSLGGASVLHRFMSPGQQAEEYDGYEGQPVFIAVGSLSDKCKERIETLWQMGCCNFTVDVANGHTASAIRTVDYIRQQVGWEETNIMAGNVCTGPGALDLVTAGANIIRAGTGSGSACITRTVTGHGMPQLSAIKDIAEAIDTVNTPVYLVADGGIRSSGDAVKALAAGADAVMIGGLLAGTDEAPGKVYKDPSTGHIFKKFAGMASKEGREHWFNERTAAYVPEGESFSVPYRGSARDIIESLVAAIKDGLSYSGAKNIPELQAKAKWVRVTDNGQKESNANRRMHRLK